MAQTEQEKEQTENNVHMGYIRSSLGKLEDYLRNVPTDKEVGVIVSLAISEHLKDRHMESDKPSIPPNASGWWANLSEKQRTTIISSITGVIMAAGAVITSKFGG